MEITSRSQIVSGMFIHTEQAQLIVCESDSNHELICCNPSIGKCAPLNYFLNEDLSVSNRYNSKLKKITYKGNVVYKPTIKLTLKQIADKFGYDVSEICIVDDKS
jgi:hypothetical protein